MNGAGRIQPRCFQKSLRYIVAVIAAQDTLKGCCLKAAHTVFLHFAVILQGKADVFVDRMIAAVGILLRQFGNQRGNVLVLLLSDPIKPDTMTGQQKGKVYDKAEDDDSKGAEILGAGDCDDIGKFVLCAVVGIRKGKKRHRFPQKAADGGLVRPVQMEGGRNNMRADVIIGVETVKNPAEAHIHGQKNIAEGGIFQSNQHAGYLDAIGIQDRRVIVKGGRGMSKVQPGVQAKIIINFGGNPIFRQKNGEGRKCIKGAVRINVLLGIGNDQNLLDVGALILVGADQLAKLRSV
ncbi:MAG: hypothetical protein LUC90_06200 [Lachnospiraceae bacterium]|nr:hypothetical protein [Lachnospiraceae bacterium]